MEESKQIGEVVSAWDDINPPMASVRQQGQPSTYLAPQLQPATNEQFRNELTACLVLVAPAGMSEDERRDWLRVAWATLGHLPPDILQIGCNKARQTCDHPSKIVPAILRETEQMMTWRREAHSAPPSAGALPAPPRRNVMDRRGEPMSEEDTAELNTILESLGATARYRADGSRYTASDYRRPESGMQ